MDMKYFFSSGNKVKIININKSNRNVTIKLNVIELSPRPSKIAITIYFHDTSLAFSYNLFKDIIPIIGIIELIIRPKWKL